MLNIYFGTGMYKQIKTMAVYAFVLLFSLQARAQSITGRWTLLTQQAFDELAPDGGPLHFRDRFSDGAQTIPLLHIGEFNLTPTGLTTRQVIAQQAATFGWPLKGIYISASGQHVIPHTAIHVSMLPTQTGPIDQRPGKVAAAIDLAFENRYKNEVQIDDPTDPDFGQTVELRNFWALSHFWKYQSNNLLYTTKIIGGGGDYQFIVVDGRKAQPPANWWQEFN